MNRADRFTETQIEDDADNLRCSECGDEIVEALLVVDPYAPWLCLECSGAALSDFVEIDPNQRKDT
jgi:RNA polymerase-binding transcription factor DksA